MLGADGEFEGPLDVLVRNGLIEEVGSGVAGGREAFDLDGAGLWLMPGMIDCHLHAGLPSYDELELLHMPFSRRVVETVAILRRTLESGVTSARDAGGVDAGVRGALASGLVPGPKLQVSVVALGATGGHGDGFLAGPGLECAVDYVLPDYPGRPPHLVDGPAEMRKAVRLVLRAGADWVKLLATGGVLSGRGGDFECELSGEEIAVAVVEAERRRRFVMVHALGGEAIAVAVRAGARSIEHGVFLTERDAKSMADRGCALVPTLSIYSRLAEAARRGELTGERAARALAAGESLGEAVAIARAAGVRVVAGSDFGHRDDHGANLGELALLHQSGLSVSEALLAGTAWAAELCNVGDRVGRLAPGYHFDALLLDSDPGDLRTLGVSGTVTGVFCDGVPALAHPRLSVCREQA
jgi:imidazolonepropionase-like amidohydrolase